LTFTSSKNFIQTIKKVLLDNPFYRDAIELFILQDTTLTFDDIRMFLSTLENITSLSSDWSYISNMLSSIKSSFACFEVNRFVAVETEADLEKAAAKYYENGTFLIGIVFENVKMSDTDIPKNFNIKLRTNVDNVPDTSIVRPWYTL
jgi:hypothetical protein